jgi:TPR repeat protein
LPRRDAIEIWATVKCYASGQGVNVDKAKAVQLYGRAAEQGYALAQYNLGACYARGEGVDVDNPKRRSPARRLQSRAWLVRSSVLAPATRLARA